MLAPTAHISAAERDRGIRNLMIDAAAATAIGALNSGVVLLALALHIGATSVEIGVLAAIPLLTQVLQAPAVRLVERFRKRRLISVVSVFIARIALPIYAAVPFIPSPRLAAIVLIVAALLHYGMNAIGACSWNSWIRDLIPDKELGQFFARRGVYGTAVSAIATVGAATALAAASHSQALGDAIFGGLYLFGFFCGLISTAALARVPEPVMPPSASTASLARLLRQPLGDGNFRSALRFLASWQFAVNLATPFFTVYFVRELGFSMSFVLMLAFISQLANIAVVRGWGALSDRFTNKSVLAVSTPAYVVCVAAMAFVSDLPDQTAQAAYLVVLHVLMGAAGAGVALASGNIVMKLSPPGAATSYMATNALVGAIAAGLAPMVGGAAADFFGRRRLELQLTWFSPNGSNRLLGVTFSHWEFFFLLSAFLGLYAIHRLSRVHESGSVQGREVAEQIWVNAVRTLRNASSVAGPRLATVFPAAQLINLRQGPRLLIERFFESGRDRHPDTTRQAVGAMLDATYQEPAADPQMDELLRKLDKL